MPSGNLKTNRYAFICLCLVALLGAQLPGLVSNIVGANSPANGASSIAVSSAAAVPSPPGSSLCISGTLNNADFVYNRAGTTPPCSVFTTGNFFDAYTFTVTGCAPATVTVSTCTGPCGAQTSLDTVLFLYQKTGGAAATQADPIFKPANPCTNLISSSNNFCGLSSQVTTTLQTTAGSGDFVVILTSNLTGQTGPYNLSVSSPTCTIVQQPLTCVYVLSPTDQSFQAAGGTGTVTVTAGATCAWTAASNDSFIHVTSGALGTGNGSVGYSVDANSGGPRIGSLTIAGQTFTVTQEAGTVSLPCIRDALVAGNSFVRPSAANPISCPSNPANPTVFYKAYEFTLSGCSSGIVTASTCGTSPCNPPAGTLADTILFIYRKSDGSPSTIGSPIFNPATPCTNAVVGNNNFAACGTLSQITTALNAGNFVVVVTSNGAGQTGTFNLAVTVPGPCAITRSCAGDTQPPTITCPAGTTVSANASCQAAIPNVLGGVTASDNCAPAGSLTITQSPAAGTSVGLGTYTITVTATDTASNSSQCTTTFTVVDNTPPVITINGANPFTVECHTSFTDPGATANDNCAGSVSVTSSGSVDVNTPGAYTITYTATDGTNTATATRTVNVVDTTPPVITTCATNKTISANSSCQAAVPNLIAEVVATDSCSAVTVIQSPAPGTLVGVGNTTVTLTAKDASNNQSVCTAIVTVVDDTPPTVTCPAGTTASANANCQAPVPNVIGGVTASDNCTPAGSLTITQDPAAGSLVGLGVTTITVTVKDSSDNAVTCTTTFTVNDTTPPTITCPANITRNTDPGQCSAAVTFQPTAADNCTGVTASCNPASGSAFAVGTTTVTCTATDAANNHASCSFQVTVNDTQPPTITCPANITHGTDPNSTTAIVTFQPSVSDNCPGVTFICTPASGSTFNLGSTTVNCTATDAHSNTASCSFTVTVVDSQPPSITCPPNQTGSNDANQCGAVVTYPSPTVTDNTPGATFVCSPASGSFFPIGTTMVTCTATDSAGNHSNCGFTVTVNDTQPPSISCPPNVSSDGNIFGSCSANVSTGTPTASDNCPGVMVTGVRSDGLPLSAPYPQGTTTITWTARDASNNTATCQQTVSVTNPAPVVTITGPPSGSIYAVGTTVNFTGTFTDNLGGTHTATWMFDTISQVATVVEPTASTPGSANASFTFTTAGVYAVKLTVNDGCGGITTATTIGGVTAIVVIYDPNGPFVTGGGWINSPAGAYVANPLITGKGNFGINAKYHNGATVPTGETEFHLNAVNFVFHSTAYEWLIVTGPKAQYQGSGTVNGAGNYGFKVTVIDGKVSGGGGVDRFRIKIWNKNAGNAVVYDNEIGVPDTANPTTPLGGGSIVIH